MTTDLSGATPSEIAEAVAAVADRPFRGRQVASWVIDRMASSFDEMTDLPASLREELGRRFSLAGPPVVDRADSSDGSTKFLFALEDDSTVEAVTMPGDDRTTLCLSSQTGCAVGCTFCVTGALGAGRNLTAAEIVGQFRAMARTLPGPSPRINVVFMGMGEPLLNLSGVGGALDVLTETVSPRRITVSTSGIVPGLRWLAARERQPKLAISLNAPDQGRRVRIMPISARWPLDELLATLRAFPLRRGRRITFEYVLIRGFNDAVVDAAALGRLLAGLPAKLNVIPLNEDPLHLPGLHRPDDATVDRFGAAARDAGLSVTVRWSKGRDVAAACGQLKGRPLPPRAGRATSDHCSP